jgi:hypothetical protein
MQGVTERAINPFHVWAELVRGLNDRFIAQLTADEGLGAPSLYAVEVSSDMRALIRQCEKIGVSLKRLTELDGKAFEAFARAMESS